MKNTVIIILILKLLTFPCAALTTKEIEAKLVEFDMLAGVDEEQASKKTTEIAKLMYAYIAVTGRNTVDPTPEALQQAHDLYSLLNISRVKRLLAVSSQAEKNSKGHPYGPLGLLFYAEPTDELRHVLIDFARNHKKRGLENTIYFTLFNLGLDTQEMRIEITERLISYEWGSGSAGALSVIHYYPIPEAIPFLKAALTKETTTLAKVSPSLIANSALLLGPQAVELLPLLEIRLNELLNSGADPRLVNDFTEAIETVNGTRPLKKIWSINGAGQVISGRPQRIEIKSDGYYVGGQRLFTHASTNTRNTPITLVNKTTSPKSSPKINKILWGFGSLIMCAGALITVWLYKRQN
ncbi:MAG: hypothetical protein RL376_819 [Verrucomicrobiota bacterium]|jgi:hypothetical protein